MRILKSSIKEGVGGSIGGIDTSSMLDIGKGSVRDGRRHNGSCGREIQQDTVG